MSSEDLSDDVRQIFVVVNIVCLNAIFSMFGIAANVLNIHIFLKQGFSENINISLFVLAVADLGELLAALVFSVCDSPAFTGAGLPVEPLDIINVAAAFPRAVFSMIRSAITAFITFERCMCVVLPLKVKTLISPSTTLIVLSVIVLTLVMTLVPFYATVNLGWQYDFARNRTILRAVYTLIQPGVDINVVLSIHTGVQVGTFICVTLFTAVLVIQLRRHSKFRNSTARRGDQAKQQNSKKTTRTIALVVTMAAVYITCYSPNILLLLVGFVEPRFAIFGPLINYFLVCVSFGLLFESINSSVAIFLYYTKSVNYRKRLSSLFRW